MKTRFIPFLLAVVVGLSFTVLPVQAAEKEEVKKEEKKDAKKPSNAFLNRWKKIQTTTKKKAYETQQTRTVAGVRAAEAEDAVLDQLYYKGGVRYPSRVDLKNAITQLQEIIKADPHSGPSLNLYALVSTLKMENSGYMYMLRKLRDLSAEHRTLAYGLMELMAHDGNRGEVWEAAVQAMDRAVSEG